MGTSDLHLTLLISEKGKGLYVLTVVEQNLY
jgi:hypothetical protein